MKRVKGDEQTFYICGNCKEKIFYLKTEEPPIPCPECDVDVTITGKYAGTTVGQHGDGVTQTAGLNVRSRGWEHKGKKNKVPNKIKLDLTQY
jgi:DNA-directed RNA polymerase subunit RPC12/RpoP